MTRNSHVFDLLIIGAGTSGMSALKEALKHTDNVALIHNGPFGTTCARVGCMPSKALIHAANLYDSRIKMPEVGIEGFENLSVNIPKVLAEVRHKRDHFVKHVQDDIEALQDYIIKGKASFESPTKIRVDNRLYHTEKTIIATGSSSVIPEKYNRYKHHLITSDNLFELKDLPKSIAVIGLGAIGLEIAQAMAKLGIEVTGINRDSTLNVVQDKDIDLTLRTALAEDMKLWFGVDPDIKKTSEGITLYTNDKEVTVEKLFIAAGRKPNLDSLNLDKIGIELQDNGVPSFDRFSMKVNNFPIYLAGDVTDERAVLHESADEGRRAAYHTLKMNAKYSPRYTPMQIIFTKPVAAVVGDSCYAMRHDNIITGSANFENQGRAVMEQEDFGRIHIYANAGDLRIRGAEIAAPAAEHLAHFLALAITQRLTIKKILETPFYHPTLEEGLKTALKNVLKN